MQQGSSTRRRHRGYVALLFNCLALMGCLMLPSNLSQVVSIGYLALPFVLLSTLGRPIEAGHFSRLRTSLYRLLTLITLMISVLWFFAPSLFQRSYALAVFFLWSLLALWSCERLIRNLALERRINREVLFGALAGYLLLGLAAGLFFSALEILVPGSFSSIADLKNSLSAALSTNHQGAQQGVFVALNYFAFITLTTTGYGDIHPVTPQAQMLCVFLAISGTTYLALVMGLLISRYTARDVGDELER